MDITQLPTISDSIIKNGESLLAKLFGTAFSEIGETWGDKVKYRRFKNQVEIFSKASDLLKKKGINAKPIAFKHLVSLIDLTSLEEDPKIQEKWANIIANLSTYDSMEIFNKNCISLLNLLSPDEINILDYLYSKFVKERGEVIESREGKLIMKDYREIYTEDISFDPWELGEQYGYDDLKIKLFIENMVSLGLLQYEEIEIEEGELIKSFNVHLSYLGLYFIRLCKYI